METVATTQPATPPSSRLTDPRIDVPQPLQPPQRMRDAVERREPGIQAVVRILEHDLHVAPLRRPMKIPCRQRTDQLAQKNDVPIINIDQPTNQSRQRRLARPGFPDQPQAPARHQGERNIVHRLHPAGKRFGHMLHVQQQPGPRRPLHRHPRRWFRFGQIRQRRCRVGDAAISRRV